MLNNINKINHVSLIENYVYRENENNKKQQSKKDKKKEKEKSENFDEIFKDELSNFDKSI